MWVLFLDALGAVIEQQQIRLGVGGFGGSLGAEDQFGWSVAGIGDLNNDGLPEIAVGANRADNGGDRRGVVWILSLASDGTVPSLTDEPTRIERAISATGLADFDEFGAAVAALGDLDDDGVEDVAVGARFANDGGVDAGAVFVLRLNGNGTIKAQTRVSATSGGFAAGGGSLASQDAFGSALASGGDLDGDGREDLVVGLPGDDSSGSNAGGVWVLYLNTDGTVEAGTGAKKIDASAVSGVFPNDAFGAALGFIGDVDLDGDSELAVGSPRDDDGSTDRGAIRVLFLAADESVASSQKISSTQGGFSGALNGGLFGASVAGLGDLDGDGRSEIAVGEAAAFAPAGVSTGAVWNLSLVGPGDAVWEGDVSADWFTGGNWSGGVVPSPTIAAVIRAATTPPVIGSNPADAECLDLALGWGALLTLPLAAEDLRVQRNVRSMGAVQGNGELRLVGDGSVLGSAPIEVPVLVDTAGTVAFLGDLTLNDDLRLNAGTLAAAAGSETTVAGSSTFLAGVLQGDGILDLDGPGLFSGTDVSAPPTLEIGGDLTIDPTFSPLSGLLIIDGPAGQVVNHVGAGTSTFFDLCIESGSDVTIDGLHVRGDLKLNGIVTVEGSQDSMIDGDMFGFDPEAEYRFSSSSRMLIGGEELRYAGVILATPALRAFGPPLLVFENANGADVIVDAPQGLGVSVEIDLTPAPAQSLTILNSALEIAGSLEIVNGTLESAGDLELSVETVVVGPGGAIGAIDTGDHILTLRGTAVGSMATPTYVLDIDPPVDTNVKGVYFEHASAGAPFTFNVRSPSTASVSFSNWGGTFGGPAFEDTADVTAMRIQWGATLSFFTVHERPTGNDIAWRSEREGVNLVRYELERMPLPSGTPTVLIVSLAGPSLYAFTDSTAVVGQPYRYTLYERLDFGMPGLLNVLGVDQTDGARNPGRRPGGGGPSLPQPLTSGGSTGQPVSGPAELAAALDALTRSGTGEAFDLRLAPGVYPAFEVPAGGFESLRIAAEGSGLVRIDAAQQPLVIRGLRAHQSVELEGLLIDGAGARHPAVLVQESTGPVLFEAVHVVGAQALELRQALAVLLQHSELTGVLTMLDGSVATGIASRVEPPEVLGGSRWIANAGRAPRLEVSGWPEPEFSIATASGGSWTLLAAPRLGLRELPGLGGVLLLDPATLLRAGPYWRLSSDGRGQTSPTMPPGLETWPLRFQALVHGSGSLPALSNVVRGP